MLYEELAKIKAEIEKQEQSVTVAYYDSARSVLAGALDLKSGKGSYTSKESATNMPQFVPSDVSFDDIKDLTQEVLEAFQNNGVINIFIQQALAPK